MCNLKTFFFNGDEYYSKQKITILELIKYFGYNSSLFVLEYNNKICEKKKWGKVFIKNKDRIEIVTIVGGG